MVRRARRCHRPDRWTRRDDGHSGRCHAGRLCLPHQPSTVGAASTPAVRVCAARGRAGPRVRPARAGRDIRPGEHGVRGADRTNEGRFSSDPHESPCECPCLRRRVSRQPGPRAGSHSPADPPGADHCLRDGGHSRVRANGHARRGDRDAVRAGREPHADPLSTVHGSARAVISGCSGRTDRRPLGTEAGQGRVLLRAERRSAVLDWIGAEDHDGVLCRGPCGGRRGDARRAARTQGDRLARAGAAPESGQRRFDVAIRACVVSGDDRPGGADGDRAPAGDGDCDGRDSRSRAPRAFPCRGIPRRPDRARS